MAPRFGPFRNRNYFGIRARSVAVKWIRLGLLLLIAAGWTASGLSWCGLTPADGLTPWDWRRTRDGWQRAEWLMPTVAQQKPALHPSVVAMLELLLSIGALAAFPNQGRKSYRIARTRPRGDKFQRDGGNRTRELIDSGQPGGGK